jgi:hypothetical protein
MVLGTIISENNDHSTFKFLQHKENIIFYKADYYHTNEIIIHNVVIYRTLKLKKKENCVHVS